jgi:hypothetical protein
MSKKKKSVLSDENRNVGSYEKTKKISGLSKSYMDRLNLAIENRKQRKDAANAAKANAKASQGLEGQEG